MHELFEINTTVNPPFLVVLITGALDMGHAFCIFWPANVIPMLGFVNIMQLYIPFETFFGRLFCRKKSRNVHYLLSLLIFVGVSVSYYQIHKTNEDGKDHDSRMNYANLAILAQFFNVISHQFKEKVVRSMLIDQTQFFFDVAIAQSLVGIILFFILLDSDKD